MLQDLKRSIPIFFTMFLLAGCASSSICDQTCLSAGNDKTLYIRLKGGEKLTLYDGSYTVSLVGDSGSITGIGQWTGNAPQRESRQWSGTISLTEVASIETQHFSLSGTLIGCAMLIIPGILLKILGV